MNLQKILRLLFLSVCKNFSSMGILYELLYVVPYFDKSHNILASYRRKSSLSSILWANYRLFQIHFRSQNLQMNPCKCASGFSCTIYVCFLCLFCLSADIILTNTFSFLRTIIVIASYCRTLL